MYKWEILHNYTVTNDSREREENSCVGDLPRVQSMFN